MHAAQMVMSFAPAVSYAASDFIAGAANEHALAMVARFPDWPYSIALLYGPEGCGKTHLAHMFAAKSRATFVDTARVGAVPADQLLVGNHAWVLDGIETVQDEAALAQLINLARARGDYLLLTARNPAAQLGIELPDLRSRLLALPAWAMGAPDDALLAAVLAKAFADRQLRIAPNVLQFAVTHLERSYLAIQRFAGEMDQASLTEGRAVTMGLVRQRLNPHINTL